MSTFRGTEKRDFSAELMTLAPKSDAMLAPWAACLHWAIGDDKVRARYKAETGKDWTPARSPIERLIDAATGSEGAFLVDFARWMNANIWGEINGRACDGDEPELAARETREGSDG